MKQVVCLFLLVISGLIQAQNIPASTYQNDLSESTDKSLVRTARKKTNKGDYSGAITRYQELYKRDSTDVLINFELGLLYYESDFELIRSQPYFESALRHMKDTIGEVFFYLGKTNQLLGNYEKATEMFTVYKNLLDTYGSVDMAKNELRDVLKEVSRQLEMCRNAMNTPRIEKIKVEGKEKAFKIRKLENAVNSPYDDYSPVISNDSMMLFTSRREESTGGKKDEDGKYFEDIFISFFGDDSWMPAVNVGSPLNTKDHEASNAISANGKKFYLYKGPGNGSIYLSEYRNGNWSNPEKLGKEIDVINSNAWETSLSMAIHGNEAYVVSDRKGGFGNRDIYKSVRIAEGNWGALENLGSVINTEYEEDAPFVSADGKYLYFSSTGHNSMGGFDIFRSENVDGKWSEPVNMGMPVNTPSHDIYFSINRKNTRAWFSSSRIDDGYNDMDIYEIEIECENIPSTTIAGKIGRLPGDTHDDYRIVLKDKDNISDSLVVHPDPSSGYSLTVKPGKQYRVSLQGKKIQPVQWDISIPPQCEPYTLIQEIKPEPLQDNRMLWTVTNAFFNIKKVSAKKKVEDIQSLLAMLTPDSGKYNISTYRISSLYNVIPDTIIPVVSLTHSVASADSFPNVLFDFNNHSLKDEYKSWLDKLAEYLKKNTDKSAELTGYADNLGSASYNKRLSRQRAAIIKAYLVDKGISSSRINVRGEGEASPLADNSTDDGRRLNRRVEINLKPGN